MFDNNDPYNVIKQIAVDAAKSTKPCDWRYGYVKSTSPITISMGDDFEIGEELIDLIEFGSRKKESLEIGDRLILLQKAGGQLFLCLDVIRGGD